MLYEEDSLWRPRRETLSPYSFKRGDGDAVRSTKNGGDRPELRAISAANTEKRRSSGKVARRRRGDVTAEKISAEISVDILSSDVAQHWVSLATFLESDWNEVDWQGVESREDGYLYALEGYWHRIRHARKRPQLYGLLAVPSALVDVELDSVCALAKAISSGDRSSELELAKRLTDRELQLKTEADEQHPCSTCPSPPDSGLDKEEEGEREAPPVRTLRIFPE
ncbi:hypothetical protein A4X06_0g9343 [Tilletia controversa]|uniref:Uncharacterized protein n=1 Tax=Tilletia controversa TaxID=13291 RepID=A0A8X7SSD5_9BASI|nr:hypothetical protein A4X06_0g9343 [Tilletia controversa]